MPGLAQRIDQFSNGAASLYSFACTSGAVSANGFWSKHRGDISYNQLQKFWSDLSPQARQELLRIDKPTLFEQARKNMYCSRCNGLLLEGFMQIVMYGKSLQQEGAGSDSPCNRLGVANNENDGGLGMTGESQDEIQDPSVHPWGGLTTSRDGTLTLMDCYLYSKSLMVVQNVFDNARARERERELLYPDACGGGGRGWISQGMASYGRGHGPRETCALHTARLSCDTLVDFWSALGEETRQSLLRMKEEDFIERLMYRFDSKRFCRDCRRNVIREFKELKELKRMRKEPRCTSWFCVADTAFHYEVSEDTIQADWQQTFTDTIGTYHHFEWAVGTGEGKSDILEFENVGMNACVEVNGLDIAGLSACFITLRAWKLDGRCNEFSVKAHALKGQQCVHCRLVVGDGYVTITRGESIRRFFEHAEEAEEEEDDDSVDKDGNEVDGECSRPQKHAKSPELAREFLLDAATVIFKEQVEKAFREGTARQNAHSIFVCLALKLLEERVHVACKEIITLEKQMKLLEEEEKEKREEEKRRERRRAKEREKKLRRKERLKGKEKDTRDNKSSDLDQVSVVPDIDISKVEEILPSSVPDEEPSNYISFQNSVRESGDIHLSRPPSPDIQDELFTSSKNASLILQDYYHENLDGDVSNGDYLLTLENLKFPHRKVKLRKEFQVDPSVKWTDKRRFAVVSESGATATKAEPRFQNDNFENISRGVTESSRQFRITPSKSGRNFTSKFNEKSYCFNRRYDSHSCSCNNQQNEYRAKLESVNKLGCEIRSVSKSESGIDVSKPFYRVNKYNNQNQTDRPKSKTITSYCTKKVWEPMESSQKKHPRSNSDSDIILSSSTSEEFEPGLQNPLNSVEINHKDTGKNNLKESSNDGPLVPIMSTLSSSSSSSDNGSSCLSEGDSNLASSLNPPNPYSISTLDFENSSQQSEGKETSVCPEVGIEEKQKINGGEALESKKINVPGNSPTNPAENLENGKSTLCINTMHQGTTTPMHNNNNNNNNNNDNNKSNSNNQNLHLPMFQPPYYHQNPVSWPSAPASGLVPFPYPSHYLFSNPLGYGLNGNSRFCMQYGSSLPYLPSSLHNPSKIQVYPQVVKVTGTNSKEQHKESLDEANKEGGETGKSSSKVHKENPDFSLFHFGGPVAVATGNKSNPVCSKEGIGKDICSNLSADHCDGDPACYNKAEATIEEYNLFTGIRFSIF